MYAQLLEDAGYTVESTSSTPATSTCSSSPASIDVVPEYVGGIVDFLNVTANGADAEPLTTSDAAESIGNAQSLLEEQGITLLEPSEATDTNAFFVTQEYSEAERRHQAVRPRGRDRHPRRGARLRGPAPTAEAASPTSTASTSRRCCRSGSRAPQTYQSVLDGESQLGLTSHHRRHPGEPGPGAARGRPGDPAGPEPRARGQHRVPRRPPRRRRVARAR